MENIKKSIFNASTCDKLKKIFSREVIYKHEIKLIQAVNNPQVQIKV